MTLSTLSIQAPDPLLHLIAQFKLDPRSDKIDMGVGVYRNPSGETPVLRAVKRAEARLLREQATKSYLGISGDQRFVTLMRDLVLGDAVASDCIGGAQTPGGSGALRLAAELLVDAGCRQILIGQPGWIAHRVICLRAGLIPVLFDNAGDDTLEFNIAAVLAAIKAASPGDAILLQASCDNPSGRDPGPDQWAEIASALVSHGVVPILDIAYQGLGNSLDADVAGLRLVASCVPYALIAASCDKNFGLYRDRTGALLFTTPDAARSAALLSNVLTAARGNWSMPPDHGAAVVRLILDTPDLRQDWENELEGMRRSMVGNRLALRRLGRIGRFDLDRLATGVGMFCTLPLSPAQIEHLRVHDGIYLATGGRINVGGFMATELSRFAEALAGLPAHQAAILV